MIVAYHLDGQDNDSYMFEDYNRDGYCRVCSAKLKPSVNPTFRLNKKIYDVSYTYDGYFIVSQKFKKFCSRKELENVIFHDLYNEPGFFYLEVLEKIEFDTEKRETLFTDRCPICKVYKEVTGATPVFLKNLNACIEDGIFRTDILFGENYARHPLIIGGVTTAKEIKKERFKGIDIRSIEI